jgi:hypothetical protein
MSRITIVTAGHVSTSPRVWREAQSLSAAGHEVTVVGLWLTDTEAQLDLALSRSGAWRLVVAADLRRDRGDRLRRTEARVRRRLAGYAARAGAPSIDAQAYSPGAVLRAARATQADLYIGHLLVGMWVARALLEEGQRVAIDIEDWHSEEPPERETTARAYARSIETSVLHRAVYCSTTSHAMAAGLAARYRLATPHVIYNSDPSELLPSIADAPAGPLRMIWFSQTLGSDRGLDDAWGALNVLGPRRDWELTVLCNSTPASRAEQLAHLAEPLRGRVRFVDPVDPRELPMLVSQHDVGLAVEPPNTRNRDLTASNKIFRYLQSGLFVAAAMTAGQSEVLRGRHALGRLYPPRDHAALAELLNEASDRLAELRATRHVRAAEATRSLAYETQAAVLRAAVQSALESRTSPTG